MKAAVVRFIDNSSLLLYRDEIENTPRGGRYTHHDYAVFFEEKDGVSVRVCYGHEGSYIPRENWKDERVFPCMPSAVLWAAGWLE